MAEWEDRTAKERQERNNAASLKDTEMKQEAESGLAKFHADRKTANASAETKNVADEQAAAEALANETNPWNTVFSMCADPSLTRRFSAQSRFCFCLTILSLSDDCLWLQAGR